MKTYEKLKSRELAGAVELKISCQLEEFPMEILELSDTLEILDLSTNRLSALPDDFGSLERLRILFLSDNLFTEIPEVLSRCSSLTMIGFKSNTISKWAEDALPLQTRWLILTDNQIQKVPESIGELRELQKLMLAGNKITRLPETMSSCKNLELLRLSANSLERLPQWLFDLPKLSWLGSAGNQSISTISHTSRLDEIDWEDLLLQEELGAGASGVVYRAKILNSDSSVAVKVFKGRVTSDGYPADEISACISAGIHYNLNTPYAKVVNHPEAKEALIFELIPPSYCNLGAPPSLQTCTRDTYGENLTFSMADIERISLEVALAALHLHKKGINHGDLYAHNILTDSNSHNLLGDFGAATCYDRGLYKDRFERLEVRAFGCLLDDLLSRSVVANEEDERRFGALWRIREASMSQDVATRPLFGEICELLASTRSLLA